MADLATYAALQLAWHLVNRPDVGRRYCLQSVPDVLKTSPVPDNQVAAAVLWLRRDNDALRARVAELTEMLAAASHA